MIDLTTITATTIQWSSLIVLFLLSFGALIFIYLYISDILQTKHAIRRNYPVIGRFRYFFEYLGNFFRQYFFAMDREELPFNRAERSWVYRAAKNVDSTIAFGSTRKILQPGEIIFLNCAFPTLQQNVRKPQEVCIGQNFCRQPYTTRAICHISGMSYGAISKPAVLALTQGAAKAGVWVNTGEGGLTQYHLRSDCDLVVQIGTAKFGVRTLEGRLCDNKLKEVSNQSQVKMFEIKLSQGAKPGKGGILPAIKVTQEIADIRGITPLQDSISPNAHPDLHSPNDLLKMIAHIREITGKPVGFKMVVGNIDFFDSLFQIIQQQGIATAPDFITIDGAEGGSGAAPQSLMDYVGLPLSVSLPKIVDKLIAYGLRDRIKIIASGKLISPSAVAWALCIGADFVTSARGYMFALGCIQAMQCNKNTCPTGITTHNKKLQRGLVPTEKSIRVLNYIHNLNSEIQIIANACGVSEPRKLTRKHAHIITESGQSKSLAELHHLPPNTTKPIIK